MSAMYDNVSGYAADLRMRIKQLQIFQSGIKGGISAIHRNGQTFFMVRVTENCKCKTSYIAGRNEKLIKPYANAKYAKKVLPVLTANLNAAESFLAQHTGLEETDAAQTLDPAFIPYCSDIYIPKDQIISEWMQSKGPEVPRYGGEPMVMTARGDCVRSKSEAIIANLLHANGLAYLYEKPLYLDNKYYAVFPDFTILRLRDMKEIYWEHFGMMDDPDYLNSALKKISDYISNGMIPGKDLVCTFESSQIPLSSEDVRIIIETMLL